MLMRPIRRAAAVALAFALALAGCGPGPTASPTLGPSGSASASTGPLGRIDAERIRADLEALESIAAANGGVRTAGTAGYEASVQYVAGQLRDLGYAVQTPEFEMATFTEDPGATISIGGGGATFAAGADFHAMIYSGSGDISARVASVGFDEGDKGGCAASDFAAFPSGAIALTPPGPCFRRDVVLNAVAAGASALVVAYTQWPKGAVRRPTLLSPDGMSIPAISASASAGEALREAADTGRRVTISVHTRIESAMVHNVLAESHAVAQRIVMLGGHLDGVHDGPGINDNGSGVAALLDVARVMAEEHPTLRVRFAFWGGEEFGLLGSRAYVESLRSAERAEIAAYLNFDMIGSPNFVPIVYDAPSAARGSKAIADYLGAYLRKVGIGAELKDIGASTDHAAFDAIGIPTGGIFTGASEVKSAAEAETFGGTAGEPLDACYHLACDTLANVDVDHVAVFAGAALAVLVALASGQLPLD
jgi:Zn-dependent M28 family amino/carboxypeptidase